ncbi:glycerol kinase [Paenibacillus tianjinensis]|uniref:Glycerol kinase n=1 Tax=Paenibacillus tianjinensis TaxID=2810347 RepID=A0ABX7L6L3_9BACL|nr:glycerol kinase [Paenibacillus tianjinensis]QSF43805.1 glycerol kinase [Paenibacillus tianjinensis]
MSDKVKFLSTTALSKEMGYTSKELFALMMNSGLINRENDTWVLTEQGKARGGIIKNHPQHGSFIAWDEKIKDELKLTNSNEEKLLSAVALSQHFGVSKLRMNPILSELGLLQKGVKGWLITKLGESIGGKQFEYDRNGVPYVCWEASILTNKRLLETIKELRGESVETAIENRKIETVAVGFREKYEATHRSADGHYVRSRAEMLIDNWLYMSEIVHAYERKLPIEEDVYCDFYLPVGKVYIEFWGLENDARYNERKKIKLEIYKKYGFNLIEIDDKDILNLDDIFPKKLLKFGIQAY